jgi:hypothetical protein
MARLLIQCPETGDAIPTGHYLDTQFLTEADVSSGVVRDCPACGGRHEFTDDETFMETDDDHVSVDD